MLHNSLPTNGLDFSRRASLPELMDEPCSRDVLRACLRDLARVNRWFLGYRPVLEWLEGFAPSARNCPLRILDVGCGYGDGLRRIEQWARERGVRVELTGLDLNPDTAAIAAEASPQGSAIEWVTADVFEYEMNRPVHLIISSLFAHHLLDDDVVRFIGWMEKNARLGWFVNDLSRAPIPYHLFHWFSRAARLHRFVQHDGPVSFLRAFAPEDWERLCAQAGLNRPEFEVTNYKPARLCVSRRKRQ
ncbi:MAG TPA: methyltransferase domain-containing protein [Terracidiphilus sp.]